MEKYKSSGEKITDELRERAVNEALAEYFIEKIQKGHFDQYPTLKFFRDLQLTKEDLRLLLKFLAYVFVKGQPFKKGLILVGPKDSGKTTLINDLLGSVYRGGEEFKFVTAVSFESMAENKKERLPLLKCFILFESEVQWKRNPAKFLMEVIGDDEVYFEVKYKRKGFSKKVPAKVVIYGNRLPQVDLEGLDEDAWYSRWILLKFHREFPRNEKFKSKLVEDVEGRSILFSVLLSVFREIVLAEGFEEQSLEYIKSEWMKYSNPIEVFISKYIEEDETAKVLKKDIYEKFLEFLKENKISIAYSQREFNYKFQQSLMKLGIMVKTSRTDFSYYDALKEKYGAKPYVWEGITCKGVPTVKELIEKVKSKEFFNDLLLD